MSENKTTSMTATATAVTPQSPLFFNPRDPAFNVNPYPYYKRLREEDPVHRSSMGSWFIGRYEHVRAALRDHRFSSRDVPSQLRRKNEILRTRKISDDQPENLDALITLSDRWFPIIEPPDHTRLRRLVNNAFHRKTVEQLREDIQFCAEGLLAPHRSRGEMDLVKEFASLFPQQVIAKLLGFPPGDFSQIVGWVETMARMFDPLVSLGEFAKLNRAAIEVSEYLKDLIAKRRSDPQDDLISFLIEARDEQDKLSEQELISTIIVIFGAGEETAVNMIGNGMLALFNHPDEHAHLRLHPEILDTAVEEFLRYDAPLQMTGRTANEDLELGGKEVKKGDLLYVILGSANRDPDHFPNADGLDLERKENHHMAFGDGIHWCVGAPLARVEGQEAFRAILGMLPDLELPEQTLQWRPHNVLRGMRSMKVKFRATAAA